MKPMLPAGSYELLSSKAIEGILDRLGHVLTERLQHDNPVVLVVLHGGMVFAAHLILRMPFAMGLGAVAVSRYGDKRHGGELHWAMSPSIPLKDRLVVLVDDILDEGVTIAALQERILALGAKQCLTVVMLQKNIGRPPRSKADYVGATIPNEYVFGFGLDIEGQWRNLPAIYAVTGADHPSGEEKSC